MNAIDLGRLTLHSSPEGLWKKGYNISNLEDCLLKKDFVSILNNSELFWYAFCKAIAVSVKNLKNSDAFCTQIEKNYLVLSGREHIKDTIRVFVENIRLYFVANYTGQKSFTLLWIKICDDIFLEQKTSGDIDLKNWLSDTHVKLYETWFYTYVLASIENFCELIGAKCQKVTVTQKIATDNLFGFQEKKIEALEIQWKESFHFVYSIKPKAIPKRALQNDIYDLYQKELFCDYTLVTEEGNIKVHSLPFFLYGGDVLRALFSSNMKESNDKSISFKTFSLKTVRVFVDFVYLGEKSLDVKTISDKQIDVCELLELAHSYQIQPLVDCCTNLLSLLATIDDLEKIKNLAELYHNDHLKKLYEFLFLKNKPGLKV